MNSIRCRRITLGSQYISYNLGGVIHKELSKEEVSQIKTITLSLSNDIWYGNYTVPDAIGFSTPVNLILNGTLNIYMTPHLEEALLGIRYTLWSKTFSFSHI
uniref:Uncharacterized protein n=1 Tax=viral metagenome TaxID=1070528 RepID=A0A6C0BJX9_9ZZZZ